MTDTWRPPSAAHGPCLDGHQGQGYEMGRHACVALALLAVTTPPVLAATAAHHTQIALGDIPTWLLFLGASAAALIALRQLRTQQKDIARQARQLERQQADEVGFVLDSAAGTGRQKRYVARVFNGSRRPIRNVVCHLEPGPGQGRHLAAKVGEMVDWGLSHAPERRGTFVGHDGSLVELIRAGATFSFVFGAGEYPDARASARFTDDAGLSWQIDHNLHLERFREPAPHQPWYGLMGPQDPD
jgi:hypothetical protein